MFAKVYVNQKKFLDDPMITILHIAGSNSIIKLETWTDDDKVAGTSSKAITFEACDDSNSCCKEVLDKSLDPGAKDEFTMSESFKQCVKDPKKTNLFMSTNSTNGWKAKEIKIHYFDQTFSVCTLSKWLDAEEDSKSKQRLPLICSIDAECDCSKDGTNSCDPTNGKCTCKDGFCGLKCTDNGSTCCQEGFYFDSATQTCKGVYPF